MFTRGDFHIHSTDSDGSLTPKEIILSARSRGIDTISITDHNTVKGVEQAAIAGNLYGVSVVPGIELSTRYMGKRIHILGYFRSYSFNNSTFLKILEYIKSHKIVEARKILYNYIETEDCGDRLSILEGINFLRTFDATVVLAHPVRINSTVFSDIISMPFDGIEAKYCHNDYYDTSFFINLALNQFSFYTAGSDFHEYGANCYIGQPYLNSKEIQSFFRNSGVLVMN
jgi:predicted metal-dependent phosphoesterase TrpH